MYSMYLVLFSLIFILCFGFMDEMDEIQQLYKQFIGKNTQSTHVRVHL
jgi:hypothetical protein